MPQTHTVKDISVLVSIQATPPKNLTHYNLFDMVGKPTKKNIMQVGFGSRNLGTFSIRWQQEKRLFKRRNLCTYSWSNHGIPSTKPDIARSPWQKPSRHQPHGLELPGPRTSMTYKRTPLSQRCSALTTESTLVSTSEPFWNIFAGHLSQSPQVELSQILLAFNRNIF